MNNSAPSIAAALCAIRIVAAPFPACRRSQFPRVAPPRADKHAREQQEQVRPPAATGIVPCKPSAAARRDRVWPAARAPAGKWCPVPGLARRGARRVRRSPSAIAFKPASSRCDFTNWPDSSFTKPPPCSAGIGIKSPLAVPTPTRVNLQAILCRRFGRGEIVAFQVLAVGEQDEDFVRARAVLQTRPAPREWRWRYPCRRAE